MKRQRTIPLRENLDNTIFDEIKELYPSISNRGVEYKQTCSFLGLPCDFDFMELSDNVEEFNENNENKITVSDVFSLFTYCLLKMSKENGYYFVCHKKTILVLKIKPCKRNNRQNSDHTKMQSKQGNAKERPDAGCGIKR